LSCIFSFYDGSVIKRQVYCHIEALDAHHSACLRPLIISYACFLAHALASDNALAPFTIGAFVVVCERRMVRAHSASPYLQLSSVLPALTTLSLRFCRLLRRAEVYAEGLDYVEEEPIEPDVDEVPARPHTPDAWEDLITDT
jgi:hypothetical protein